MHFAALAVFAVSSWFGSLFNHQALVKAPIAAMNVAPAAEATSTATSTVSPIKPKSIVPPVVAQVIAVPVSQPVQSAAPVATATTTPIDPTASKEHPPTAAEEASMAAIDARKAHEAAEKAAQEATEAVTPQEVEAQQAAAQVDACTAMQASTTKAILAIKQTYLTQVAGIQKEAIPLEMQQGREQNALNTANGQIQQLDLTLQMYCTD